MPTSSTLDRRRRFAPAGGAGPCRRTGLVRHAPVSLPTAGRHAHALVAAGGRATSYRASRMLEPATGSALAERITLTAWPALLFAIYGTLAIIALTHGFNGRAAALSMVVTLNLLAFRDLFSAGEIDHHNAQVVLLLASALGFTLASARQLAAIIGGARFRRSPSPSDWKACRSLPVSPCSTLSPGSSIHGSRSRLRPSPPRWRLVLSLRS